MDRLLLEAAADLGCPPWRAFFTITVPLSRSGIVAGSLLCFIPIMGEFVIPDLLGSSSTSMIGQVLWTEFFANKDWPVASALAVMLLAILMPPILIFRSGESDTAHPRETSEWVHRLIPQSKIVDPPWGNDEWNERVRAVAAGEAKGLFVRWPLLAPTILDFIDNN